MDTEAATQLMFEALACAVANESGRAADALTTLGENSDAWQMYSVCCGFAEAGKQMLGKIGLPVGADDSMLALQELVPGAAEKDPPNAFAMRFLTAYANGDTDMTWALFETAMFTSATEYVDSVCALLANVAGICRLAQEAPARE